MGNDLVRGVLADDSEDESPPASGGEGALELCLLLAIVDEAEGGRRTPRRANEHRDRDHALVSISKWSRRLFYRHFRCYKEDFLKIRESIIDAGFPARREDMAIRSSGSPISLDTRIFVTLRMLAGADYLDLAALYGVSEDKVTAIMFEVLHYMNICQYLDNIRVPQTPAEVQECLEGWRKIMQEKYGVDLVPGTLLAGDGYVIEIAALTALEIAAAGGTITTIERATTQAFCDAHGRFRYFEMKWPGATNDIIAYKTTELYRRFFECGPDSIYRDVHLALDEAYSSIGGDQHLCPYSKWQLKAAQNEDPDWRKITSKYHRMLCFNNRLSGQRITIERVFGMYARRWGILRKPLPYGVDKCQLIAHVCARLHNMNVNHFLARNETEPSYEDEGLPKQDDIMARMANEMAEEREVGVGNAKNSSRRDEIRDKICRDGFYYCREY